MRVSNHTLVTLLLVSSGRPSHPDTFFAFLLKQPLNIFNIFRYRVMTCDCYSCCMAAASESVRDEEDISIRSCPLLPAASCRQPFAIFRKDLPEGSRQRERSSSRYLTSVVQPALNAAVPEVRSSAALPALLLYVLPALPGWSRPLLAARKQHVQ